MKLFKFGNSCFKVNKKVFNKSTFKANVRSMATLKDLKGRISSIKQISKITTSMKQVAAAKLKQQQNYTEEARPFYEGISQSVVFKSDVQYEVVEKNKPRNIEGSVSPEDSKDALWLICTTDKGLCGSLNTTLVRPLKATVSTATKIVSLGGKGFNILTAGGPVDLWFTVKDLGKDPFTFKEASLIADRVASSGRKKMYIYFNRFVNVLISKPTTLYLPSREEILEREFRDYEFEEPATQAKAHIADFFLASSILHGCVENACSEIGARMTSMETASNNATDIVEELTIEYNSRRQAAINKELSELVGGSDTSGG